MTLLQENTANVYGGTNLFEFLAERTLTKKVVLFWSKKAKVGIDLKNLHIENTYI